MISTFVETKDTIVTKAIMGMVREYADNLYGNSDNGMVVYIIYNDGVIIHCEELEVAKSLELHEDALFKGERVAGSTVITFIH